MNDPRSPSEGRPSLAGEGIDTRVSVLLLSPASMSHTFSEQNKDCECAIFFKISVPDTFAIPEGEYARDDDGDGFCEVHVNTLEGFWSLLRSWLRPHRGVSQEKLPLYLGFFEFLHNVRARGKSVLGALIGLLVTPPRNPS